MDRSLGILLMVVFGVSGAGMTALAWLCPSLQLDRIQASLAGLIGVGFTVFQGLRFRHSGHTDSELVSVEVEAEDKH